MRSIPFVTNRPPLTGGFGPPPSCGGPETLAFGTLAILPSTDPARPGQPAGPIATAGAIDCSTPGPDLALVVFLTRVLTTAHQAKRSPLIVVHDGRTSFTDAGVDAADLGTRLEADGTLSLAPIAFTWPSIRGALPVADRDRAVASATGFSRFVRALASARRAAGLPRCLFLAQGIGVQVVRSGGRTLAGIGGTGLPADLFDQTVLLGADADGFEPGQGLDQLTRISTRVTLGPTNPANTRFVEIPLDLVSIFSGKRSTPARKRRR